MPAQVVLPGRPALVPRQRVSFLLVGRDVVEMEFGCELKRATPWRDRPSRPAMRGVLSPVVGVRLPARRAVASLPATTFCQKEDSRKE